MIAPFAIGRTRGHPLKIRFGAPFAAAAFVACALGGCATAIDGTTQDIAVNTAPQGAACVLTRDGKTIGSIAATPGAVHVEKSKYDITIRCTKAGFDEAVTVDKSGTAAASAGSFVADVLITEGALGAVDSISGADNKYDTQVDIALVAKVSAMPRTVLTPSGQ